MEAEEEVEEEEVEEERRRCRARDDSSDSLVDKRGWGAGWDSTIIWVGGKPATHMWGRNCGQLRPQLRPQQPRPQLRGSARNCG